MVGTITSEAAKSIAVHRAANDVLIETSGRNLPALYTPKQQSLTLRLGWRNCPNSYLHCSTIAAAAAGGESSLVLANLLLQVFDLIAEPRDAARDGHLIHEENGPDGHPRRE